MIPTLRFIYSWEITFMNDVMGFQKHFTVEGMNHRDALERANGELAAKRYDPEDFMVVELARKAIIRRAAA
jgi:hypothetical protein